MKSTHLTFRTFGSPLDVLDCVESCLPELGTDQVLLEIMASPINPADLNLIEGTYGIKPPLPTTPGIECSAKVIDSKSKDFQPGDCVMPISRVGGWASHAITSDRNLIRLPKGLDPHQASMLRINPATAWLLLTSFTSLSPGDYITLNATNSGVGQCIIQLANSMGIRTICFLRNESLTAQLTSLGATHIFPDSASGLQQALDTLGNQSAKLACNAVGGDSALRLLKLLAPSSTHVTYGAMARKPLTIPNSPLIFQDIRFRGLWVTHWIDNTPLHELQKTYSYLADLVIKSKLLQPIDSIFPLHQFANALLKNASPQRNGKILLSQQNIE